MTHRSGLVNALTGLNEALSDRAQALLYKTRRKMYKRLKTSKKGARKRPSLTYNFLLKMYVIAPDGASGPHRTVH